MHQQQCAILLIFAFNQIVQTMMLAIPTSPCPKMFQYRFDGTEWFGVLSVRNPDHGQPLRLRVTLSLRGKPTTDYLGEIELLTRGQFLSDAPVLYKIKFPKTNIPPKLVQITINSQVICLGAAEHSIFVTQIQLEHTRKFTFLPDDTSVPLTPGLTLPSASTPAHQGEDAFGGFHSTDALLPDNFAFASKHLKSLPLTRSDSPMRATKDICGTIDNRIRFQALHATKRSSKSSANQFHSSAGGVSPRKSASIAEGATKDNMADADTDSDYLSDVDDESNDSVNNSGANLPPVTADILDPFTDDAVGSSAMTSIGDALPSITRGAWPWLAAIYVNNLTSLAYQCGGTLISARIVVSSAHCFRMFQKSYTANEVLVFLGRHNLKNWSEEGSLAAPVDDIFIHPNFDDNLNSYDADIAVLVLKNAVRFNAFIRPACLWSGATNTEFIEGEHGIVVGWGLSSKSTSHSTAAFNNVVPRAIDAPIVSNEVCFEADEKYHSLSSNRTFCAGSAAAPRPLKSKLTKLKAKMFNKGIQDEHDRRMMPSNAGPCTGDSGAGLMLFKNNRWVLRGMVSAAVPIKENTSSNSGSNKRGKTAGRSGSIEPGCSVNHYVIYTDVAKFLDWIFAFII